MEVLKYCYSALSNFEVMETLNKPNDTKKKYGLRNLATITYETLQYLEDSACKYQTRETIVAFMGAVRKFKLTKTECLMLVNDPPSSPLHIQLLIEDSEERMTEEQVAELLEIVKQYFPGAPAEIS